MSAAIDRNFGRGRKDHTGYWCTILSATAHAQCHDMHCDCVCHVDSAKRSGYNRPFKGHSFKGRRPHSYPRADWEHGRAAGTSERGKLPNPHNTDTG